MKRFLLTASTLTCRCGREHAVKPREQWKGPKFKVTCSCGEVVEMVDYPEAKYAGQGKIYKRVKSKK